MSAGVILIETKKLDLHVSRTLGCSKRTSLDVELRRRFAQGIGLFEIIR